LRAWRAGNGCSSWRGYRRGPRRGGHRYLTDRPEQADWLLLHERAWLLEHLHRERSQESHHDLHTLFQGLSNPRVLLLSLLYFSIVVGSYGIQFFLPQIVESRGLTDPVELGFVTAIPNLAAAIGMVMIGISSDRFGERRWHVAVSCLIAAAGLLACAFTESVVWCVVTLSVASIGLRGTLGPFWALSTSFLGGAAAAGAIALINSIGNLGGHVGPDLMGRCSSRPKASKTGSRSWRVARARRPAGTFGQAACAVA